MKKNNKEKISNETILRHGLTHREYEMIIEILNRQPNLLELGIFSVMWSEHCSYKSTKKWLRTLPTVAPWVICGPGENAGIIDIGDNDAIVFKMESHNHPSFIEPYQGAATGVGGIMRDVFTMGARPIANLNSLRFGHPKNKKTKFLLNGVVSGIGDYGNCVGIPTVGGECYFHECYNDNNLVNAMSVGLVKKNKIFYSAAKGVDFPVIYVGSKTGRDGIHGATMASSEFNEKSSDNRPQVQVGDPFTEKLLMEACLELMETKAIIAIQDMGAAGLTSSSFEMASKGNCGIKLFLNRVPTRESNMNSYEIMLSETQERMLMVVNPDYKGKTSQIFNKWGLDSEEIGKITDTGYMEIFFNDKLEAKLPIKPLADSSPEYNRPFKKLKSTKDVRNIKKNSYDVKDCFLKIISSPNVSSKEWLYNQYDRTVMGDTVLDSEKADAAVVTVHDTNKAIAITSDCNPVYCMSDPYIGSIISVAETWRNINSVGATPLAITDNLNFGNPEKEEIMYQIYESIRGIKYACSFLNYPVVSGNVSLYNETKGKSIFPTPVIGAVGLIKNVNNVCSFKLKKNMSLFVIGKTKGHLDLSIFDKIINKKETGYPPNIDLNLEKKNGEFVRQEILNKNIRACHDLSDGGILIGLTEMIVCSNIGAEIIIPKNKLSSIEWLFSEDQSRYIVSTNVKDKLIKSAKRECIDIEFIGNTIDNKLILKNHFEIPIKKIIYLNKKWFYNYNK